MDKRKQLLILSRNLRKVLDILMPSHSPVINRPHIHMKTTRIVFICIDENCVFSAFTIIKRVVNMLHNTFHERCFSTAMS